MSCASSTAPMSARDTAEFGKAYLMRLGYKFSMA